MTIDQILDVKGFNCPYPILRAKKLLHTMQPGQILEVQATDPGSVKDFDHFCKQTGNTLVESRDDGQVYTYLIRKKD